MNAPLPQLKPAGTVRPAARRRSGPPGAALADLLMTFSWQELRQHPWRNAAAVVAVMLGVALAFSVHLINASALDEFAQAARAADGQADLELRSLQGPLDERIYPRVALAPEVALASPVLEVGSYLLTSAGKRQLRILGVDALTVASLSPELMPRPEAAGGRSEAPRAQERTGQTQRWALFAPDQIFLNAAARRMLGGAAGQAELQVGMQWRTVRVAGAVAAGGPALGVMDLGAAQDVFDKPGQLSRIDLRLRPGVDREALVRQWQGQPDWPAGLSLAAPQDSASQIGKLSRAYRVNLTVLALIALFTGAFLVFSVLSLSVAKRAQQFALLGVLGLGARARMQLVLWEALALGLAGSLAGLALGAALAALALKLLGGDLGSGFFSGAAPGLQVHPGAALVYGALGLAAALAGAWWPARAARGLPPAQALKGLGSFSTPQGGRWISILLIAAGAALTGSPPVFGMALGAYVAVALLLLGGITALPLLIGGVLAWLSPRLQRQTLPMLAVERARRQRDTAAVAVSGVVAALSLAVALTVMVASFRESVMQWLDRMLPADLYVRSARSLSASDTVYFSPEFVAAAARLEGVQRLQAQRLLSLRLHPDQPPVALLARELGDPERSLPLLAPAVPAPPGRIGVFVSEAVVDLFGAQVGAAFPLLDQSFRPLALDVKGLDALFFVSGVWRDYARQSGSIALERSTFVALTGDQRSNDLALWLHRPEDAALVQADLQRLAQDQQPADTGRAATPAQATTATTAPGAAAPEPEPAAGRSGAEGGLDSPSVLEFGTAAQIRAISLKMFDRSFAVTYWLQAVAIGIGLFGVAASFSAQVLARRKEFGLLAHLGFTRRQILTVVTLEGAAWTSLGALVGLGLGLVVAVVLVHVVNPQSFHWTMDLALPWARLLALCLAVVAAGTLTAWAAARAAAGRDAVLAVKEDW